MVTSSEFPKNLWHQKVRTLNQLGRKKFNDIF